jgi:hypothetical protein
MSQELVHFSVYVMLASLLPLLPTTERKYSSETSDGLHRIIGRTVQECPLSTVRIILNILWKIQFLMIM